MKAKRAATVAGFTVDDYNNAKRLELHLRREEDHVRERFDAIKVELALMSKTLKVMRSTMPICPDCDGRKSLEFSDCPSCMGSGLRSATGK